MSHNSNCVGQFVSDLTLHGAFWTIHEFMVSVSPKFRGNNVKAGLNCRPNKLVWTGRIQVLPPNLSQVDNDYQYCTCCDIFIHVCSMVVSEWGHGRYMYSCFLVHLDGCFGIDFDTGSERRKTAGRVRISGEIYGWLNDTICYEDLVGIWLIAFSHWLMVLKKMLGYCRHLSSLRCHQCRNGAIVIKEVRSSLVVSISYIIYVYKYILCLYFVHTIFWYIIYVHITCIYI